MDEEVPLDSIHPRCVTSGTHLIVGGFSGLGVELCDWLLSNGAACITDLYGAIFSHLNSLLYAYCHKLLMACSIRPPWLK